MDCGVITSKTVLLLISLIFWAAAAGLTYVGGYVIISYRNYDHFLEDKYTMLPAVIILAVAGVMFIIGLIGCCSTIRESRFGLGIFLCVILLIFVAEVAAFVLGLIYRGKIKPDIQKSVEQGIHNYDGTNSDSRAVDFLQEQLQCCGVKNYSDWEITLWFNSTGNLTSVPQSCCRHGLKNCTGRLDNLQSIYTEGCEQKLETLLEKVLTYASLVILGFAIVKFFGMLSACVVMCRKKDDGYQPLHTGTFA
ncbi:tetraspanin-36-like [Rhinatrema bivittatum]|uniref:tetraspanin-36-like n=1 Tax=Rhinatrema bivittatum TaxID=194408 RepID=UPI00112A3A44|nr:tetraspanin-36-like [Rhinatrema bivittatum]